MKFNNNQIFSFPSIGTEVLLPQVIIQKYDNRSIHFQCMLHQVKHTFWFILAHPQLFFKVETY